MAAAGAHLNHAEGAVGALIKGVRIPADAVAAAVQTVAGRTRGRRSVARVINARRVYVATIRTYLNHAEAAVGALVKRVRGAADSVAATVQTVAGRTRSWRSGASIINPGGIDMAAVRAHLDYAETAIGALIERVGAATDAIAATVKAIARRT